MDHPQPSALSGWVYMNPVFYPHYVSSLLVLRKFSLSPLGWCVAGGTATLTGKRELARVLPCRQNIFPESLARLRVGHEHFKQLEFCDSLRA